MTTGLKLKPEASENDDGIPDDQPRRGSAMSNDTIDNEMPWLEYRWMHGGAQYMDLPTAPVTTQAINYVPFSASENIRLEEAYQKLSADEKVQVGKISGKGSDRDGERNSENPKAKGTGSSSKIKEESNGHVKIAKANGEVEERVGDAVEPVDIDAENYPDPGNDEVPATWKDQKAKADKDKQEDDLDKVVGVSVSQDSLFEVSIPTMSLEPVFWAHTGKRVPVIRATWFINDDTHPCEWELAEELEKGYQAIKPWLSSYPDELHKAIEQGEKAAEKLNHPLPAKLNGAASVVYQDAECGQLVQTGMTSYLNKLFWTSLRSKPGGMMVYRGYGAACRANGKNSKASSRRNSTNSRRDSMNSVRSTGTLPDREKSKMSTDNGMVPTFDSEDEFSDRPVDAQKPVKSTKTHRSTLSGDDRHPVPPPLAQRAKKMVHLAENTKERIKDHLDKGQASKPNTSRQDAMDEEQVPMTNEEENDTECTDLILVIHGIGQQLAMQGYEGFNFVYAANLLRSVMRTQAQNPALGSIIRDRRVQVLPIQWRASLKLEQKQDAEDHAHGMDNTFTMADITLPKIPAIRQVTNAVLLDIPLFMSHHRQAMIEAVCTQANRAYRLWCARNPGFDGKGRVHIIGHSLGSALAAHILSNQPTKMPAMADIPKQVKDDTKTQFLFNTSNLFLCGSPLGIFLHLDQAQIMPRKGRERTMHSPQDEALDRAGRFGCMSCDSLYNIVHLSDPIAYTLNATVDSKIAKQRPPLPITSVTAPFYSSVTEPLANLTKYFDGIPLPSIPIPAFMSGEKGKEGSKSDKPARKPNMVRLPSGIEMSGPEGEERLQGSRGDRRFSALNPHGNVDFVLPSGGVSEYLDALTSHASYWADPNFGAFLLAEIFARRLDMIRTGMGLAQLGRIGEGIGSMGSEDIPL
ncbi:hypothetical protein NliqN6_2615 [Naganishia liquefaciens]|uniref:DDHD domain-containing protein n=1 Tax=Naganishia liquefaciens TaxID=104408 RepID=A0A8H3YEF5_9TREE|nr:hypothetical protein NliqN6_2615 [Naganishia liquefaciens]